MLRRHLAHILIGAGDIVANAGYWLLEHSDHPAFRSNGEVDAQLRRQRVR